MPRREHETPYLTVGEARERFKGKWVVMRVRSFNEYHDPLAGEVLYSGRHDRAWKYLGKVPMEVLGEARQTHTPFYIFCARPLITAGKGPEFDGAVGKFLMGLRSLGVDIEVKM